MAFLSVGSSALTEASFPRSLATPQLLLSNVSIILSPVMRDLTTVFTPRGLAPLQFTPMSGASRCSEREPGDLLRDKSNVIGGWLALLTWSLDFEKES